MTNYDKLRNVLLSLQQLGPAMWNQIDEALAALAELEKAAREPVAWMWNDELGIPHASAGSKKPVWLESSASAEYIKQANLRPLYTTPPAPVAEIREVTQEMCERVAASFYGAATFANGVEMSEALQLWRKELSPTLGLVELREPVPEECERIYAFWLNSEGCNGRTLGERMGGLMFNAVRAVMWPKSEVQS